MMAQAAPLLLLLPLLLMGSQGQVFQLKYQEGQTLRVSCGYCPTHYDPQRAENRWKTSCKLQVDGKVWDRLITGKLVLTWQLRDPQASLEDDTHTGTIIVSMSNLRVKDSAIHWCGIYDSVNSTIEVIRTISLEVSPEQKVSPPKCSQTTTEMPTTNLGTPVTISSQYQEYQALGHDEPMKPGDN
ncbi:trem-like transcript 4 protein [Trichosurus vulpecula]|uniref:trem-like transcript 4 protein n=1 Tax=Trichosurus vulpecula TaxID=9337 RepID=UPI00186B4D75|nr:trem-like transcript 4 protein [Trichosurus vulpecula]